MGLQLVEVYVPRRNYHFVVEKLRSFSREGTWKEVPQEDDRILIRMVISSDYVEEVLNYLETVSRSSEGFETILFPVHTYFSHQTIEEREQDEEEEESEENTEEDQSKFLRASRQELMHTIEEKSDLTLNYTLLVIFSAIVATAGFLKDDTAVVIGAMAIAPLIGPAISMGFATVLGDIPHLGKATWTLFLGVILIVGISALFGFFFYTGTESSQYTSRTEVSLADFFLALAAGAAGAMSILNRLSSNLVGVMVAVALLPPVITFGMSIGNRLWEDAFGSFLLIMTNITCIVISAVIIFFLSGVQPVKWKDETMISASRLFSIIFITIIGLILFVVVLIGFN
ncbi:TIGR00341 family protein [Aquisalibacillus elongatus]|uniref:Putative hydrophobic protein (TIGR00341 family) n=1 Tax=Aquisalibacillus elongatus TaxID=485577 RepID=A0A3N5BRI2_9BACI|nr:TIGR00341 family protein [Aquisalibacillus elongatus]RPF50122.1 putative hydrophobic protein (TIGR00341 family) [Aquisalibacillus elongatus]